MVNPPPIQVPAALQRDPELADFFKRLLKMIYQLWINGGGGVSTGGGTPGTGSASGGGNSGGSGSSTSINSISLGSLLGHTGALIEEIRWLQGQIDALTAASGNTDELAPLFQLPALAGQLSALADQIKGPHSPAAPAAMVGALQRQLDDTLTILHGALAGKERNGAAGAAVEEHEAGSAVHPLSALQQSGASLNQVPQWNGSAWVPATISGGGGSDDSRTALAYALVMGGL